MTESAADTDVAAAFAVLADPTRIDILRALAADSGAALSFSELRERVGTADSGQFNYHLGKLVGKFVRKGEDGYRLTTAGFQVYGAILAGTYSESADFDPVDIDEPCPQCGASLSVSYVDEHLKVTCASCERMHVEFPLPPGAVSDRTVEEMLDTLRNRLRAVVPLAQRGTCPTCWGKTETALAMETVASRAEPIPLVVTTCTQCGDQLRASPGALLLSEPAVIAAHYEAGIDLREQPVWKLPWLGQEAIEVLSTDPLRVAVTVPLEATTLRATVEADGTVSAIERD